MAGEFYYGCKRIFAKLGILAIMLAVIAFFAYVYILPTVSPEIVTNPSRIVESPEKARIYEITDEFIAKYGYVGLKSEIMTIESEEWVRSTKETLEKDRDSFHRLDPFQMEGSVMKKYDELVAMEISLLRQYIRMYELEVPEDAYDSCIGDYESQWDYLIACYEEFKAADAEYQAELGIG